MPHVRASHVRRLSLWTDGTHLTDPHRNDLRTFDPMTLRRERVTSRVYFIRLGEHVKIGTTTRTADQRLAAMQLPPGAEVVAVIEGRGRDAEQELHQRFRDSRVKGEWFRSTPELEALIATFSA